MFTLRNTKSDSISIQSHGATECNVEGFLSFSFKVKFVLQHLQELKLMMKRCITFVLKAEDIKKLD